MKREFLIIIERGENNLSAYAPDLPGCVATAKTEKELLKLMEEGIELHIADMKKRGYEIPEPSTRAANIVVAA
jgi:predicted RNase H-like HicB family nuclease